MNIYENVKAAISVLDAAKYYGMDVRRGNMVCCPFHNDQNPSMKLNDTYFYCFGCGATGNVIDFVAKLHDVEIYEATKLLSEDFGLTESDRTKPSKKKSIIQPLRHPYTNDFRNKETYCMWVLCDYLHLLGNWQVKYAPLSPQDTDYDDRFVEACQMLTVIENYADSGNHAIRRTCISELHDSQLLPDRMISDFAGHKEISTTQRYYIHSVTPLTAKADVFEKVFKSKAV